ncbi:MAG: hypothetical protein JSR61_22355, partial [Proteobacteria bacterium]|nr:hypothetical protein [Pseudomonadota bacterium]
MTSRSRHRFPRPALWIAAPVFIVCAAGLGVFHLFHSLLAALVASLAGALLIGLYADRRLGAVIGAISAIAGGDRYTSLPQTIGDGAIQSFGEAADRIRAALIEADTVAVDQNRRETEARLHHAGRHFFTGNFRRAIDDVVTAFTQAGERIRGTADELTKTNRLMAQQVTASSDAAARA